jgi:fatty acid-binding protein DegV
MSVAVVTDSATSLPLTAAERLGIGVVPMTLVLGGLVYADGDLSPEELISRAAHESVSTSSPTPGAFLKAVASATEHEEAGGRPVSGGGRPAPRPAHNRATRWSDRRYSS